MAGICAPHETNFQIEIILHKFVAVRSAAILVILVLAAALSVLCPLFGLLFVYDFYIYFFFSLLVSPQRILILQMSSATKGAIAISSTNAVQFTWLCVGIECGES